MKTKLITTAFFLVIMIITMNLFYAKAQVTITFRVDLSGIEIGTGGVHLAGTFGTENSTLAADWEPGAAGSEMQQIYGDVYNLKITFPASSVGDSLQFLFVRNNIWNDGITDFSEGNPGQTSLNLGCGVSDGGGGYNRMIFIPAANAVFYAQWDFCGGLYPVVCDEPTNLFTSNVSFNKAKLNWNSADGSFYSLIRYRPYGSNEWTIKKGGGLYSYKVISQLNPSTMYEWQMRSVCTGGSSEWTPKQYFTTDPLRLSDNATAADIKLFPNPATTNFSVLLSGAAAEVEITISDLTGKVITHKSVSADAGAMQFDTDAMPAGIYFVKANCDGKIFVRKLEVEK